jgi:MYXO-CTERM domain-containing protein
MKNVIAIVSILAAAGAATAGVQSFALGNLNVTNSFAANTYAISGSGTDLVRGIYLSGDWTNAAGGAWSSELNYSFTAPGPVGVVDRRLGGVANSNPYTFGTGANWWSNGTTNNNQEIRGEFTTFQPANSSFTFSLRQTFLGSSSNISNARLNLLTDIIPAVTGSLEGISPIYKRASGVTGFGTGSLGSGSTYRYSTYTFTALADGIHQIGARYSGFDGYLSLYQGAFDANNALTNIIGVDDDSQSPVSTGGSDMFLNLIAGQSYTVVISHFSTTPQVGTFTSYVAGPVPTPGALAALGLAGLAASRRRR